MSDAAKPWAQARSRLASSISEIENVMRQTDSLKCVSLPHEVETVIAKELAHFFDLGQQVSSELICDLRNELQRVSAKVDMVQMEVASLMRENEILKLKLDAMGKRGA